MVTYFIIIHTNTSENNRNNIKFILMLYNCKFKIFNVLIEKFKRRNKTVFIELLFHTVQWKQKIIST